ncbi:MAG: aldehyde ferredoxin oxidoreductase [Bacillota bacterium]
MSVYGWSGKILRVDLSTGRIWTENTLEKYKDYLGATGIGYKVMWDEVPVGVKAFDPENRIIFGGGPLIGSGSPCGGRVAITSLFPTSYPVELIGSGHMGGHWGAELKFAGWDAVIIQGKAANPVWLSIMDDKVEIRDARQLWGSGIYRATAEICAEMGAEAQVAAIGQAGENLVRMACVMTGNSHSAGGIGGVMGSKNLKAIGVRGTGSVKIKADKKEWKELVNYVLSLAGSNNQWVVPSTPQPWAEFHASNSRWTARKGLFWGAANPPVETGTCDPRDMNSIGYRCQKAVFDLGPIAEQFTVRMDGCHSCPIRCHMQISVPTAEKYGVSRYAANTCIGWWGRGVIKTYPDGARGMTALEGAVVGKHMTDDYGVWCNYGQINRDFQYAYEKGILKKVLSEKEYKSIPFDLYEKGSPEFIKDFVRRIAFREGEFGYALGEGSARVAERWGFEEDYYGYSYNIWNRKLGYPKHHSTENGGQVGALINSQYNRDAQCHSHVNFYACGLPLEIQKRLAADVFGSGDAIDAYRNYTPMNVYKAKFAKWSLIRKELHDSLPLCNWMFPWIVSPLKERGYKGDTTIEAKLYSAVTGDKKSEAELDLVAERIFNLHRALTIRGMGTKDMRKEHDLVPDWAYDYPKDAKPFTAGHDKMDREDMQKAFDMFYKECGWDVATGAPTKETYQKLGLGFVADELGKLGLLP